MSIIKGVSTQELASAINAEEASAPQHQLVVLGAMVGGIVLWQTVSPAIAIAVVIAAMGNIAQTFGKMIGVANAAADDDMDALLAKLPAKRRAKLMKSYLQGLKAQQESIDVLVTEESLDKQPAIAPSQSARSMPALTVGYEQPSNEPQASSFLVDEPQGTVTQSTPFGFDDWDAAIPDNTPVISLALFDQYPTILIYGAPGSGKTTFARAIAARRAKAKHRILVLDPHANPANWPYPIAGAGMNFDEITKKIKGFEFWVKKRYEAYAKGVTEFEPLTFICDEMTNWGVRVGPAAAELVKSSLSDTRKVNMGVVYIGHDRTLTALGDVKGLSQLRDSALLEVKLEAQVCHQTGKAVPTGYGYLKLPGGYSSKVRIPSLKELEAEMSGVEKQQVAPSPDATTTTAADISPEDQALIEKMRSLKAEHPDWGKVAIITAATGRKPGGAAEYVKAQELYSQV